jgi:RecB family endonuclease NucS
LGLDRSRHKIVLEKPTVDEAYQAIKAGTSRHKTIIIVGNCWVDYEGRASSRLEPGERIVILKSDGSALIHRPRNYDPVNWQPPGSLFRTRLYEGKISIRIFRRKENEVLEVGFDDILLVAILDLKDTGEFHLYASEEDMQQAILAKPSLLENGFRPIAAEKPVEPGFIDIFGVDGNNVLTVVEIKRKAATKEDVLQLKKYMNVFTTNSERQIRGILVAPELARGTQRILASLDLEFKALSPQKCAEVLKRKRTKPLIDFFSP